ncbi:MAG: hypothetical protein ACK41T_02295 [Pseudobdellovibrio sp.]
MKNKFLILSILIYQNLAFAERGTQVDIDGFSGAFSQATIKVGNSISAAGFVLVCIGLMIPGFREYTKRALPWTIAGIAGIILATRYWS